MMKKIYSALVILAAVICSCAKDNIISSEISSKGSTLIAYAPGNTKTAFGETVGNQTKMVWSAGDELFVMGADSWLTSHKYSLKTTSAGQTTGVFNSSDPITETGNIAAFYPYSWSKNNSTYNQISIPSNQTPSTIENGIMPMYGKGSLSSGLTFEHLCSIIRLRLYTSSTGKTLTRVAVFNGNNIAGRYFCTNYNHFGFTYDAVKDISYTCNQPLSTDSTNPTIVDILVSSYGGLKLSDFGINVTCSDGSFFSKTMSNAKNVSAGSIVTFTALECELSTSTQISYDGGNNWDSFDGTVTIPNTCTDIALRSTTMVLDNSTIRSIITAIEKLPAGREINLDISGINFYSDTLSCTTFQNTKRLADVVLPNNIKHLPNQVFSSSSCKAITIPAGCIDIGKYPLRYCSRAHIVVASGNNTYRNIGTDLYSLDSTKFICADYSKTDISVIEKTREIYMGALFGDYQINSLTLPSTLTKICENMGETINLSLIDASALSAVPFLGSFYYNMSILSSYPGYNVTSGKTILVKAGMVHDFSSAGGWSYLLTPVTSSYPKWRPWTITSDGY